MGYLIPNFIINFLRKIKNYKKNTFLKKLQFTYAKDIIYLGSNYGGWNLLNHKNLENEFIISACLGEDASFDVELISKFNCKIIVVDPTPRAIEHYKEIIKNTGNEKLENYKNDGNQKISSYDLKNINKNNFILVSKALYNIKNKELKFFAPPNKNHVSLSLNIWQNNYKHSEDFIHVKTTTVKDILDKFGINQLQMIKLDIEGAEIEVLNNMIDEKIFPKQILVEFDELNELSSIAISRFEKIHKKLVFENYELVKTNNNFPNFLYVKSTELI